jgi:hypothetical protein
MNLLRWRTGADRRKLAHLCSEGPQFAPVRQLFRSLLDRPTGAALDPQPAAVVSKLHKAPISALKKLRTTLWTKMLRHDLRISGGPRAVAPAL